MKDIKLLPSLPDKTKFELALERLEEEKEYILKLLADYLLEGIMEDVSSANIHRIDFWEN